jgi:DNA polymerase-3 subunit gamma/tau
MQRIAMIHNEHLNLARKWRSKNFDQIIGQELSVKMLRNSLYLNQLFPVYLFSGQRGCGKTSTARIFASAINCEKLIEFQRQPKLFSIPCLACASCVSMSTGQHPDFIEMDAASHTGVDNVRNIIDSSSMLPLMGRKKIYLIDEAHMLSKAAFNALLKILEEPPASALFILATTDVQKIIETVRSRCFQLLFKPVGMPVLVNHLKMVCEKENINFDEQGLKVIVKETDGSVRDAINLLEQVRFSSGSVTKDSVAGLLGQVDDEAIVILLDIILNKEPSELLNFLNNIHFATCSVEFMWHRFLELLRATIWLKYDVRPEQFSDYGIQLKTITSNHSVRTLTDVFSTLCEQEQNVAKTTSKHAFFEMILLQLCQKKSRKGDGNNSGLASQTPATSVGVRSQTVRPIEEESEGEEDQEEDNESNDARWGAFVNGLEALQDPLINSIFTQARFNTFDIQSGKLELAFSKEFVFFNDWLNDTKQSWLPLLQKQFGANVSIQPLFTLSAPKAHVANSLDSASALAAHGTSLSVESKQPTSERATQKTPYPQRSNSNSYQGSYARKSAEQLVPRGRVMQPQDLGEHAHMLLKYFPGIITEISESIHG